MEAGLKILSLLFCYSLLYLLCFCIWKKKAGTILSEKVQKGNWMLVHIRHAGGMIIMVLIPVIFLPVIHEGLLTWPQHIDSIQVFVLMITGLLLFILSFKETEKISGENTKNGHKSFIHAIVYMVLRISFLVSYEWFFRGIIFFSCVSLWGVFPAIVINTILYAFIHSFSGRKEFLGSIPFGIILCVFTIWWQSIWPAILLHLFLSIPYESILLHRLFYKPLKQIL